MLIQGNAYGGKEQRASEINKLLTTEWAKLLWNSFLTLKLLMNHSNPEQRF